MISSTPRTVTIMVQHVALFLLLTLELRCFFVTAMKTGMSRSITTTNPERDAGAVAATHPVAARVHGMPISTTMFALLDGAIPIFADEQDEETPSPVPQHDSDRKLHQTPPSSSGSVKALKKRPKVDVQLATMAPKDVELATMTTKQEAGRALGGLGGVVAGGEGQGAQGKDRNEQGKDGAQRLLHPGGFSSWPGPRTSSPTPTSLDLISENASSARRRARGRARGPADASNYRSRSGASSPARSRSKYDLLAFQSQFQVQQRPPGAGLLDQMRRMELSSPEEGEMIPEDTTSMMPGAGDEKTGGTSREQDQPESASSASHPPPLPGSSVTLCRDGACSAPETAVSEVAEKQLRQEEPVRRTQRRGRRGARQPPATKSSTGRLAKAEPMDATPGSRAAVSSASMWSKSKAIARLARWKRGQEHRPIMMKFPRGGYAKTSTLVVSSPPGPTAARSSATAEPFSVARKGGAGTAHLQRPGVVLKHHNYTKPLKARVNSAHSHNSIGRTATATAALARGDGRSPILIAHHPHSPDGSPGGNKGKRLVDLLEDSGSACSDGPSTRASTLESMLLESPKACAFPGKGGGGSASSSISPSPHCSPHPGPMRRASENEKGGSQKRTRGERDRECARSALLQMIKEQNAQFSPSSAAFEGQGEQGICRQADEGDCASEQSPTRKRLTSSEQQARQSIEPDGKYEPLEPDGEYEVSPHSLETTGNWDASPPRSRSTEVVRSAESPGTSTATAARGILGRGSRTPSPRTPPPTASRERDASCNSPGSRAASSVRTQQGHAPFFPSTPERLGATFRSLDFFLGLEQTPERKPAYRGGWNEAQATSSETHAGAAGPPALGRADLLLSSVLPDSPWREWRQNEQGILLGNQLPVCLPGDCPDAAHNVMGFQEEDPGASSRFLRSGRGVVPTYCSSPGPYNSGIASGRRKHSPGSTRCVFSPGSPHHQAGTHAKAHLAAMMPDILQVLPAGVAPSSSSRVVEEKDTVAGTGPPATIAGAAGLERSSAALFDTSPQLFAPKAAAEKVAESGSTSSSMQPIASSAVVLAPATGTAEGGTSTRSGSGRGAPTCAPTAVRPPGPSGSGAGTATEAASSSSSGASRPEPEAGNLAGDPLDEIMKRQEELREANRQRREERRQLAPRRPDGEEMSDAADTDIGGGSGASSGGLDFPSPGVGDSDSERSDPAGEPEAEQNEVEERAFSAPEGDGSLGGTLQGAAGAAAGSENAGADTYLQAGVAVARASSAPSGGASTSRNSDIHKAMLTESREHDGPGAESARSPLRPCPSPGELLRKPIGDQPGFGAYNQPSQDQGEGLATPTHASAESSAGHAGAGSGMISLSSNIAPVPQDRSSATLATPGVGVVAAAGSSSAASASSSPWPAAGQVQNLGAGASASLEDSTNAVAKNLVEDVMERCSKKQALADERAARLAHLHVHRIRSDGELTQAERMTDAGSEPEISEKAGFRSADEDEQEQLHQHVEWSSDERSAVLKEDEDDAASYSSALEEDAASVEQPLPFRWETTETETPGGRRAGDGEGEALGKAAPVVPPASSSSVDPIDDAFRPRNSQVIAPGGGGGGTGNCAGCSTIEAASASTAKDEAQRLLHPGGFSSWPGPRPTSSPTPTSLDLISANASSARRRARGPAEASHYRSRSGDPSPARSRSKYDLLAFQRQSQFQTQQRPPGAGLPDQMQEQPSAVLVPEPSRPGAAAPSSMFQKLQNLYAQLHQQGETKAFLELEGEQQEHGQERAALAQGDRRESGQHGEDSAGSDEAEQNYGEPAFVDHGADEDAATTRLPLGTMPHDAHHAPRAEPADPRAESTVDEPGVHHLFLEPPCSAGSGSRSFSTLTQPDDIMDAANLNSGIFPGCHDLQLPDRKKTLGLRRVSPQTDLLDEDEIERTYWNPATKRTHAQPFPDIEEHVLANFTGGA